jgi:ribonuclease HI
MKLSKVEIYTDGSCLGNPGPGGYGAIIRWKEIEKEVSGYDISSTNNKMELHAVIAAMQKLTKPCDITVYTDSQYVIQCASHDDEWRNADNRPNSEVWTLFSQARDEGNHTIRFMKLPAHSGNYYNERCHKLAHEKAVEARHVRYGTKVTKI